MLDQLQLSSAPIAVRVASRPVGARRKRAFDLLSAALALVLISPLFACAALMVKFTSPGPVFFRQRRVGYGGRRFYCYKFRTMAVDADVQLQELLNEDALA